MKLWKRLALLSLPLVACLLLLAQGTYGVYDDSTYTGDDSMGPAYFPQDTQTREVGAGAICRSPQWAYGAEMGIWTQQLSGCQQGSDILIDVYRPCAPGTCWTLKGVVNDGLPSDPPGSGPPQAWYVMYNWCSNIRNPIVMTSCRYGCDASSYTCH